MIQLFGRITPFHEPGDTPQNETYAGSGWAQPAPELPEGWLLWHSYSDYSALDSRLFLRSPDGETQEIVGSFIHAMNSSFGKTPEQIVFMAIDPDADEWDIFRCDNGTVTNLTQNSGFRNEDPKWSPDGKQIVFKRGHWDSSADDFVYDLALMDAETGAVTMLTDDRAEQAMPCFSADGKYLCYTEYADRIGSIIRMDLQTGKTETVFSESGVNAYYPVPYGSMLYFTKWYSAENRCDCIMQYDGRSAEPLPFDSADFDCSDACPVPGGMICCSTKNGTYDLYFYDGEQFMPLTEISSGQNDLGACFFPLVRGDVNADGVCDRADAEALLNWLLSKPDAAVPVPEAADLDADGKLTAADLSLLKQVALQDA